MMIDLIAGLRRRNQGAAPAREHRHIDLWAAVYDAAGRISGMPGTATGVCRSHSTRDTRMRLDHIQQHSRRA